MRSRCSSPFRRHPVLRTRGVFARPWSVGPRAPYVLVLTLAGLSIAVVNALFHSPWGTFTVACTIPIALVMGVYLSMVKKGDVVGASLIGVVLLLGALIAGPYVVANPSWAAAFTLSKPAIAIFIPIYGFVASVLPVWLLLSRGSSSSAGTTVSSDWAALEDELSQAR